MENSKVKVEKIVDSKEKKQTMKSAIMGLKQKGDVVHFRKELYRLSSIAAESSRHNILAKKQGLISKDDIRYRFSTQKKEGYYSVTRIS